MRHWVIYHLKVQRESLTEAEKLEAGYKLSSLVDETLVRFASEVRVSDDSIFGRMAVVTLLLSSGESPLRAKVSSRLKNSPDGSQVEEKEIMIMRAVPDAMDHPFCRYHTTPDGDVLRFDGGRSEFKPKKWSTLKEELDDLDNLIDNVKLEIKMGLNDLPVGPDEIDKVAELVSGAEQVDPYTKSLLRIADVLIKGSEADES